MISVLFSQVFDDSKPSKPSSDNDMLQLQVQHCHKCAFPSRLHLWKSIKIFPIYGLSIYLAHVFKKHLQYLRRRVPWKAIYNIFTFWSVLCLKLYTTQKTHFMLWNNLYGIKQAYHCAMHLWILNSIIPA